MTIYGFCVFNRFGECLYHEQWNKQRIAKNLREHHKLIFGLIFSLKVFCDKLSPKPGCEFHCYRTSSYKLHYFDTPTGLKFVLITDPTVGDLRDALKYIYSSIFVEYSVKNPLQPVGVPITCTLFQQNLNKYVRTLSNFF